VCRCGDGGAGVEADGSEAVQLPPPPHQPAAERVPLLHQLHLKTSQCHLMNI